MLSGSHASSLSWTPARTRTRAPLDRRGHIGKRARCLWLTPFHCHLSPPPHPPLNLALRLSVSLERLGCQRGALPKAHSWGFPPALAVSWKFWPSQAPGHRSPPWMLRTRRRHPLGVRGSTGVLYSPASGLDP